MLLERDKDQTTGTSKVGTWILVVQIVIIRCGAHNRFASVDLDVLFAAVIQSFRFNERSRKVQIDVYIKSVVTDFVVSLFFSASRSQVLRSPPINLKYSKNAFLSETSSKV